MKFALTPKNLSLLIAAVTVGWIATGLITGTARDEAKTENTASGAGVSKLLKIEELSAQPYTQQIAINGATKAHRIVDLKPEVEGRVVELPVKKGSQVSAGQLVVRLDDRDRKEKLAEAKAKVAAREIEYKASQTLEQKGYRPRIGLAESRANLEQARVELAQARLNYSNTRVLAPFAGRLEELNVEMGDFLLAGYFGSMEGRVMARLVEANPLLVAGQVAEKDLPLINRDAEVTVELSDGRLAKGRVRFLSQLADSQTRSFPVEIELDNSDYSIPVGMTATIRLSASQGMAYLVSSSVLGLDDEGKVGVKIVDEQGVVHFAPVTLLANTEKGLWIGGLPERIRLVTQGQAFVNEGQKVDAQEKAP